MKKFVITSFVRTPIGAYLGSLKEVPVQDLAALTIHEAVKRSNLGSKDIKSVVLGHAISTADAANLARVATLMAGLDESTPAYTVNRICGSGIQAVISTVQEMAGCDYDIAVAGGAESLSRVPYYLPLEARYQGFRNGNYTLLCSNEMYSRRCQPADRYPSLTVGLSGENVVAKQGISREDQDLFAYHSQMKAKAAMACGRFSQEIVPVVVKTKRGVAIVDTDEHPRPDATLTALAKLKPVFKEDGTLTAGNSSGMNDAAAAMVIMTAEKAKDLGLQPLASIGAYAFAGISPEIMGLGPVAAIGKLLKMTGLSLQNIDLLEINEAFAGQVLGCLKEMGHYIGTPLYDSLNVNGGAIALGHPLGMSGARLVGTIACEFQRREARYAIASACIGGGMGIALLLEKP